MAYSYQQILESQYQRIADEQAQAVAELEAGRVAEDAYRTTSAADRILELDKSREALDRRAQGFIAGQQAQPQGNKYGLSHEQAEIARKSYSAPGMTDDQKDEAYARNVQKYHRMKASGDYAYDQGKVFK